MKKFYITLSLLMIPILLHLVFAFSYSTITNELEKNRPLSEYSSLEKPKETYPLRDLLPYVTKNYVVTYLRKNTLFIVRQVKNLDKEQIKQEITISLLSQLSPAEAKEINFVFEN